VITVSIEPRALRDLVTFAARFVTVVVVSEWLCVLKFYLSCCVRNGESASQPVFLVGVLTIPNRDSQSGDTGFSADKAPSSSLSGMVHIAVTRFDAGSAGGDSVRRPVSVAADEAWISVRVSCFMWSVLFKSFL
jgi:hypothetical protein